VGERKRRGLWLAARIWLLILVALPSWAAAADRSARVTYANPTDEAVAGVALYSGGSRAEVEMGINLVRIDLGLRAGDSDGLVRVVIPGFDDTRDYYVALRSYDSQGRESTNSAVAFLPASAAPANALYFENFESYVSGADPVSWVDSVSGGIAAGDASSFTVADAVGGGHSLGVAASAGDLNATVAASGANAWASYEFSGRLESPELGGQAGVTVLSAYPDAQFYYRLARGGTNAFALTKRGTGSLTCASSSSTGVSASAGSWMRFRVRVTRFDGRNRVRASLWPDGGTPPSAFQVDCWDKDLESNASGRIGVFSSGISGTQWDDLLVVPVNPDGAPPGYGVPPVVTPPPTPPPVTPPPVTAPPSGGGSGSVGGYTSQSALEHWWRPGWDMDDLGRDFVYDGPIDAGEDQKGLKSSDILAGGTTNASVDLDGSSEALANFALVPYGIGDSWSVGAWLRPAKVTGSKVRYAFDLNGKFSTESANRISLTVDSSGHFAVEVTDILGRRRSISSPNALTFSKTGDTWYHVVAVKTATRSLVLYVNGVQVASTFVGVPIQSDVPRAMRIGGRVKSSTGYFWKGGIGSVGLWKNALRASEVTALYASGRGVELQPGVAP
jgi:concanavalin A-like lectin/glucanase superfamily protein